MRQIGFVSSVVMGCVISILALAGCISPSSTPTPRFYKLQEIGESQAPQKFSVPSGVIIGVGPIKIPEYEKRPQIVTQNKDGMITFDQFDRWGERIENGIGRVINQDLRIMLPGATVETHPWNFAIPVKYQVLVEVIQLESQLDKDMLFVVQWSIVDTESKKLLLIKRSEFRQPIEPHNYSGLVKTLSAACASLSAEIAEGFSASIKQDETKGSIPSPVAN